MGFGEGLRNAPVWTGTTHGYASRNQRMRSTFSRIRSRAGRTVAARRVAAIANQNMTRRMEKKHQHLSININNQFDQNGEVVKLSNIGQGVDNHDRVGSYCRAISLKWQFACLPGTANFVVVRMIIFQYFEDDDAPNTPVASDVLENTAPDTDNQLYSPYKQDNNNTRVLWDRLGYVCGESGSNFKVITGKTLIPGKKIKQFKFNRLATDGSNMIYLLVVSSRLEGDANAIKPNLRGTTNIRFTDG